MITTKSVLRRRMERAKFKALQASLDAKHADLERGWVELYERINSSPKTLPKHPSYHAWGAGNDPNAGAILSSAGAVW